MAFFKTWWKQRSMRKKIADLARSMLSADAKYEAAVHVRTVIKGSVYALLFEISGPFRLDERATRTLRSQLSERLLGELGVDLNPTDLYVVFHDSSRKLARDASLSLRAEVARCRELHAASTLRLERQDVNDAADRKAPVEGCSARASADSSKLSVPLGVDGMEVTEHSDTLVDSEERHSSGLGPVDVSDFMAAESHDGRIGESLHPRALP